MELSSLLGLTTQSAKGLIKDTYPNASFVKVLSPKEDILGQDERVIKVEKKDELIIYYSLF
ncbi:MAG: hypothetical protein RR838_01485 [Clostridium sp.]